ncbi:hypothetical protein B0H13DRAFT_2578102 [Mycena leptocephala]|nr:hypothetical protein B0H13DRAFT_2578102 [Mycena leptocephala]
MRLDPISIAPPRDSLYLEQFTNQSTPRPHVPSTFTRSLQLLRVPRTPLICSALFCFLVVPRPEHGLLPSLLSRFLLKNGTTTHTQLLRLPPFSLRAMDRRARRMRLGAAVAVSRDRLHHDVIAHNAPRDCQPTTRRPRSVSHLRRRSSALQLTRRPTALLHSILRRRTPYSLPAAPPAGDNDNPRALNLSPHGALLQRNTTMPLVADARRAPHITRRRWPSLVAGAAFIRSSPTTNTSAPPDRPTVGWRRSTRALGRIPETFTSASPSRALPPLPRRPPRPTSSRCGNPAQPRPPSTPERVHTPDVQFTRIGRTARSTTAMRSPRSRRWPSRRFCGLLLAASPTALVSTTGTTFRGPRLCGRFPIAHDASIVFPPQYLFPIAGFAFVPSSCAPSLPPTVLPPIDARPLVLSVSGTHSPFMLRSLSPRTAQALDSLPRRTIRSKSTPTHHHMQPATTLSAQRRPAPSGPLSRIKTTAHAACRRHISIPDLRYLVPGGQQSASRYAYAARSAGFHPPVVLENACPHRILMHPGGLRLGLDAH